MATFSYLIGSILVGVIDFLYGERDSISCMNGMRNGLGGVKMSVLEIGEDEALTTAAH